MAALLPETQDPQDGPVPYLQRTRDYCQALGYGQPYQWACFEQVPFQPLARPLAQSRIALITTAAPYQPDQGDQGPGAPYNAGAKFYAVYSGDSAGSPDLRIAHVAIDRQHTTAADIGSWFPLAALRQAVAAGRIGGLTPRFHGAPTNRNWKLDCCNVDQLSVEQINRRRAEFDRGKDEARRLREAGACLRQRPHTGI